MLFNPPIPVKIKDDRGYQAGCHGLLTETIGPKAVVKLTDGQDKGNFAVVLGSRVEEVAEEYVLDQTMPRQRPRKANQTEE
jgi:hypothetical protein